jgi:hypothetical protein
VSGNLLPVRMSCYRRADRANLRPDFEILGDKGGP